MGIVASRRLLQDAMLMPAAMFRCLHDAELFAIRTPLFAAILMERVRVRGACGARCRVISCHAFYTPDVADLRLRYADDYTMLFA